MTSGAESVNALYWQAEILQALYWMRGEGLGTEIEPGRLAEFLGIDPGPVVTHMARLAVEGYLYVCSAEPLGYGLTSLGVAEGGRSFHDEFADLTHQAHYECTPGCWCKDPTHAGEPCPSAPKPPPDKVPDERA